jgi:hypothetical protein
MIKVIFALSRETTCDSWMVWRASCHIRQVTWSRHAGKLSGAHVSCSTRPDSTECQSMRSWQMPVSRGALSALCVGGMVIARAMEYRAASDELCEASLLVALKLGGWCKPTKVKSMKARNGKLRQGGGRKRRSCFSGGQILRSTWILREVKNPTLSPAASKPVRRL